MVLTDSNGISWFVASGQQGVIEQTRDDANDYRWSGNVSGAGQFGIEVTAYFAFEGVASGGHFALKHAGPNHSGCTDESECAWYDTGIRSNGDVQLQIERPHPSNDDFSKPLSISNVGMSMDGNRIGLKWIAYPRTPNGSPDNGGYRLKMYVDTSGFNTSGRPQNNWRLVYDFVDTGDVLGDYQPPDEWDVEIRNSDTDQVETYAGGLHWRKLVSGDAGRDNGTTEPPPPPPPSGGNIDPFGCKMIYPTKVQDGEKGEEWFQNNDPENDGRLISDLEIITRNGDYFVASPEPQGDVFLRVVTSQGEPFLECDTDYSQLASQGFNFTDRDWKNIEVTIFWYPQDPNPDDTNQFLSMELRASSDSGNEVCCSDYRYGFSLSPHNNDTPGMTRTTKLLNSVLFRNENITNSVKSNFYRTWTGFKYIVYSIKGPNNEDWVQVELWLCPSDSETDKRTNWTKIDSFIDNGNNWGTGGENCGGTDTQAITWGTAHIGMRYTNQPEIRWKHWSVREIDVNGTFPGDPDPDPDPCEETNTSLQQTLALTPLPVYKLLFWGDNDTTSDAEDVLTRMMTETDVSQYIFLGDGPYSEDSNEWIDMMNTFFDEAKLNKLMLVQGNHEHPESESQESEDQIEEWYEAPPHRGGLNNSNESLEWIWGKQVGNIYLIGLNSQDPNAQQAGGAQFTFVQQRLNAAKALRAQGQIDWIIVSVHKSWWNLLSSNQAYVRMRNVYKDAFADAQVDFVLSGHNHNAVVWKPQVAIVGQNGNGDGQELFTMSTIDPTIYDFSKTHGMVQIVNGNGGHEHNSFGEDPGANSRVLFANDTDFGYGVITVQGKQLTHVQKDVDGTVLFTVKYTRGVDADQPGPDPDPDPDPDPCEPPPPAPIRAIYNDLIIVYNINSDSDSCICNDPGFTPPPPTEIPCPTGQHRDPISGNCVDDDVVPPPPGGGGGNPPPGGETQAIYDIGYQSGSPDELEMASESGDEHMYLKIGTEITSSTASLVGKNIKKISWPMRKSGSPTGTAQVVIRRGSDNSIAKDFGTVDVTQLTTSTEYKDFNNTTTTYNCVVGDRVLIEYTGGDSNDFIIVWAVNEHQNGMRLTKQDNTMDDDEYRDRQQEAAFRAFA